MISVDIDLFLVSSTDEIHSSNSVDTFATIYHCDQPGIGGLPRYSAIILISVISVGSLEIGCTLLQRTITALAEQGIALAVGVRRSGWTSIGGYSNHQYLCAEFYCRESGKQGESIRLAAPSVSRDSVPFYLVKFVFGSHSGSAVLSK